MGDESRNVARLSIGGRDVEDWLTHLSDDVAKMKIALDEVCQKLATVATDANIKVILSQSISELQKHVEHRSRKLCEGVIAAERKNREAACDSLELKIRSAERAIVGNCATLSEDSEKLIKPNDLQVAEDRWREMLGQTESKLYAHVENFQLAISAAETRSAFALETAAKLKVLAEKEDNAAGSRWHPTERRLSDQIEQLDRQTTSLRALAQKTELAFTTHESQSEHRLRAFEESIAKNGEMRWHSIERRLYDQMQQIEKQMKSLEDAQADNALTRAIAQKSELAMTNCEKQNEHRLRVFEENIKDTLKSGIGGEAVLREEKLKNIESQMAANLVSVVTIESKRNLAGWREMFEIAEARWKQGHEKLQLSLDNLDSAVTIESKRNLAGWREMFEIAEARWKEEHEKLQLSLESTEARAITAAEIATRTVLQLENHSKHARSEQSEVVEMLQLAENGQNEQLKSIEAAESRAACALDLAAKTNLAFDNQMGENRALLETLAEKLTFSSSRAESCMVAKVDKLVNSVMPKLCERQAEEECARSLAHSHSHLESVEGRWTETVQSLEEKLMGEAQKHARAAMVFDCAHSVEKDKQERALVALRSNTEANQILGQLLEEQSQAYAMKIEEDHSHAQELRMCMSSELQCAENAWESHSQKIGFSLRQLEEKLKMYQPEQTYGEAKLPLPDYLRDLERSIQDLRTGLAMHTHEIALESQDNRPKPSPPASIRPEGSNRPFPVGAASIAARSLSVVTPRALEGKSV